MTRQRHFSMLRDFHLADWFTLANAFCGTGAIFAAMRYLQEGVGSEGIRDLMLGMALVPLAFVFDALDFLEVGDYSRWNIEVPVIFGSRLGDVGHAWFGPKYVFSTYSVDASLKNIGVVPESSGTIHHLGAFGGIGVGYKVVFVFAELTIAKMFAEPEIFGQKTDLGGIVVVPAGGLMLRL